ncbi:MULTISPECIES: KdsC family phosphatase [Priestia]|uniref:KdsC family phosphatase n=1 Tax=Priestia TaxID=2800373 RepID=UPI001E64484C|nr:MULTISPECIES: HAD-IIIA family hydrolase [Priestia]MED3915638.1 HAD-IIIA family hydrolase [Priestia megaterium]
MVDIKLIILDVDGVLTDGSLLIGSDGTEYKQFNVKDGMGIGLAQFFGIEVAIMTGRFSNAVSLRANELNITHVYQSIKDKESELNKLAYKLGISLKEVCFIGDDINDIPVIKKVGFSFAPNDAVEFVKKHVNQVTKARGGRGAVREAIEFILSEQNNYDKFIMDYLDTKKKIIQ